MLREAETDAVAREAYQAIAEAAKQRLRDLAHRNESFLLRWKLVIGVFVLAVDAANVARVPNFPPLAAALTLLWVMGAVAEWFLLRRRQFPDWLAVVLPFWDIGFVAFRYHLAQSVFGRGLFVENQVAVAIALVLALQIAAAAYRSSEHSTQISIILASLVQTSFVWRLSVNVTEATVQFVALIGIGIVSLALARQVRDAAQAELTREQLGRFLPAGVIDQLHNDPARLLTQPRELEATVLVSDIRGFTAWCEHRSPGQILSFSSLVQGRLAAIVIEHGGIVDEFLGDGMLAVFGVTGTSTDHAERALQATRKRVDSIDALRLERGHADGVGIRIGIGVHTGRLVAGCLGSGERFEFTVLGDTVNAASRLESQCKALETETVVSEATYRAAGEVSDGVHLGEVSLRGREQPLRVYTLERKLAPRVG